MIRTALPLLALALASCDGGPIIAGSMRDTFVARCEQMAEGNGIDAALVQPVCQCGADEFIANASTITTINTARVREIVAQCAHKVGAPVGKPATETLGG
ncbi:hypothetical protein [Qipengyuania sediminis]|uniref:hypothetical protein n=1 Tax=Qipengyuania sediminis TaxID=1532023 RepID=UPI00105975E2|nr:hypothetical protein [Qipengyuania sediminis]